MDVGYASAIVPCVCVAHLCRSIRPGPRGAEGQTSIIRRFGATGLSPDRAGLLRSFCGWGLQSERGGG